MDIEDFNLSIATTSFGENVFIPIDEKGKQFASKTFNPRDWSISQVRAMADYMEQNPDITLFNDGSGEKVRA